MKSFILSVGSALRYEGELYKVTNIINQKTLELTSFLTSQLRYIDNSDLLHAFTCGDVEFIDDDEIDLHNNQENPLELDFRSYSASERSQALRKLAYVEAAEELEASLNKTTENDKYQCIISTARKIGDEKPPKSWGSIHRWKKQYMESGRDIISLIGNTRKRGNRSNRFSEFTEILIQQALDFYLTTERPSIKNAYKRLSYLEWENNKKTGSATPLPSYDAFRKRINNLDKYLVMSKRYGKRIADMRFKAYQKGVKVTRPLELAEIDHTPLDLMVVDVVSRFPLGRPTLTSLIDKYSRMVLGFYISFTPPSTLSVIECLRHAILPKAGLKNLFPALNNDWPAHGIPETLMVDNGMEFRSSDLQEITRSLGMSIIRSPVRNPTYKGAVERHFRTVADNLLKDKPGKTFSNIFDKDEYDPAKHAIISLDSLVEIVHLWIADQYNDTVNRTINTTPNRMWETGVEWYPVRLPKSINVFNLALGKTVQRTIQHYGIDFEKLRFNSDELALIRRKYKGKVTVKYDPNDISKIYVLDPLSSHFITVPCIDYEYAHKTLFQHQLIKRFTQQQNLKINVDNFMLAERRIIEIIEEDRNLTKKIRRATKQARFKNVSQKTQHVQTLTEHDKPRSLDTLSLFQNDDFDPYAVDKYEQPENISTSFLDTNDDDLNNLYADHPDWHADYSRKYPKNKD